jgi:hypothetical protein
MSTKIAYSYIVLRYLHDITTGEFVNAGVVLYAPVPRFLRARCCSAHDRISRIFPRMNTGHFDSLMRHIEGRIAHHADCLKAGHPMLAADSVLDFAHAVLPHDDSSLQWSPVSSGLDPDPEAALERIFRRMVLQNHHSAPIP